MPNRFSTRTEDRVQTLRPIAITAGLVGAGVAAETIALDGWSPLLLLVAALGLGLAGRVWTVPGWDGLHGALSLASGAAWLAFGFAEHGATGTIPVALGGLLVGVAAGGLATDPRWRAGATRPRPEAK